MYFVENDDNKLNGKKNDSICKKYEKNAITNSVF